MYSSLWHTSVPPSCDKGMMINLLLPLIFNEEQHFNQSCIPSLACVWEGVCSLCNFNFNSLQAAGISMCILFWDLLTPTRHCGYAKSLLAFLMRSKCFRCPLMPTLNDSQTRQRTYAKKPSDDVCKSILGTDVFTNSDRPVGWFENVIFYFLFF